MASKKVKVKVGIFLIACFTLIGISLAYISGTLRPEGVPYWLEFDASVLGVYEGGTNGLRPLGLFRIWNNRRMEFSDPATGAWEPAGWCD